jgi:alkylation response protein AidB-like acyl-CoA dehydrogenase
VAWQAVGCAIGAYEHALAYAKERQQFGRFVADAEAIYSYEGTREINTLVVGRAITGLSAFV